MRELSEILELLRDANARGELVALAHLVEVRGSHFRRSGARMLITESGRWAGSVSGGCLEADLLWLARRAIASGASELVEYDMTSPEDLVWGLGLTPGALPGTARHWDLRRTFCCLHPLRLPTRLHGSSPGLWLSRDSCSVE